MDIEEIREWITIADTDFDSAKILNESARKPCEIICYLCAQAVEKYLKAFLIYHNTVPKKTHDLAFLNSICINKHNDFCNIQQLCDFLTAFSNDIRYPHSYEVTQDDANFSIKAVEKVRNIRPIAGLRNM